MTTKRHPHHRAASLSSLALGLALGGCEGIEPAADATTDVASTDAESTTAESTTSASTTSASTTSASTTGETVDESTTGPGAGDESTTDPEATGGEEGITLVEHELPTANAFPIVPQTSEGEDVVWITEALALAIGRFDPATETITEYPIPDASGWGPTAIAHAPDGNMYFTVLDDRIGRITPDGTMTFVALEPGSEPGGIVATRDGRYVYFTELADRLSRLDLETEEVESFPLLSTNTGARFIKVGLDGRVWATLFAVDRIAELDPETGVVVEHEVPTSYSSPRGLAVAPDGSIYFSEYSAGRIGRIDPATGEITEHVIPWEDASPFGMHIGPDCNLWFADNTANAIGRMTLDGEFTSFPIPTTVEGGGGPFGGDDGGPPPPDTDGEMPGTGDSGDGGELPPMTSSAPTVIAAGPDGTLVFVEQVGNKIGVVHGIPQVEGCVGWPH